MSPEKTMSKTVCLDSQVLKQALMITEVAVDLREKYVVGEKYMNYLKTTIHACLFFVPLRSYKRKLRIDYSCSAGHLSGIIYSAGEPEIGTFVSALPGAGKALTALQAASRSSFNLAQKLLQSTPEKIPENLRQEFENLQAFIHKEISTLDPKSLENTFENESISLDQLADKIRTLESRNHSSSDNIILQPNPSSSRSSKMDINEKYPENLSRESLIDLDTVINLPPVPEDIFTTFSNANRPIRTSSLSSLKSMRKIKLFLQKAESSDDEDSSDNDEHDFSRLVYGDSDESKASSCHSPSSRKLHLGNIKEETQD